MDQSLLLSEYSQWKKTDNLYRFVNTTLEALNERLCKNIQQCAQFYNQGRLSEKKANS